MKRETGQVSSQTVRRGDDQVENVMFVVGWKVNMLSKVEGVRPPSTWEVRRGSWCSDLHTCRTTPANLRHPRKW